MKIAACLLICISLKVQAQPINMKPRMFQFSLVPGIGTNGLHSGGFDNIFSLNLTSGYSSANKFLEIGIFSNANEKATRGLQIGGLANVTGINLFKGLDKKEIEQKLKQGAEANLTGMQVSGLMNRVLSNVYGSQVTGGINSVGYAMFGFQFAGISNVVRKYSFGFQLAGLSNVSYESMDGVQLSTLTNYTKGGLYGVQISAFNEAGFIEGRNGYDNDDPTGVQVGIINKAKERMNGYQVGLINIAGRMQGTQIGLVNIYKSGKETGTRDGTSIGLLNLGDAGHFSVYANELFLHTYEFATGTRKNARILSDGMNKYIRNSLIYSTGGNWMSNRNISWSLGYALKKYYYNRSGTPHMTEIWYYAYGVNFLYINSEKKKFSNNQNIIIRPEIMFGRKIHPRLNTDIYVFLALSVNAATSEVKRVDVNGNESLGKKYWPGISAGIQLR